MITNDKDNSFKFFLRDIKSYYNKYFLIIISIYSNNILYIYTK